MYSIPTDCCQRSERQGWLNDLTARAEASVYNFDLNLFYEKFLRDIRDTQDPVSGAIADTAPFRRGNMPADPVSSSYLILPDLLYTHYGNRRPMAADVDGFSRAEFPGRHRLLQPVRRLGLPDRALLPQRDIFADFQYYTR